MSPIRHPNASERYHLFLAMPGDTWRYLAMPDMAGQGSILKGWQPRQEIGIDLACHSFKSMLRTGPRWDTCKVGHMHDGNCFEIQQERHPIALSASETCFEPHPPAVKPMADHMPGVVYQLTWQADGSMAFTYISPRSQELFGLSSAALQADPTLLTQAMDESSRARYHRSLWAARQGSTPWVWEGRFHAHGQEKWVQALARPVDSNAMASSPDAPEGDAPEGSLLWTGFFLDTTERKHTEKALEQALADLSERGMRERLRAEALRDTRNRLLKANPQLNAQLTEQQTQVLKSEKTVSLVCLVMGLAHEINNPLAGALCMVEALQHTDVLEERRAEYVKLINANLLRIQSTVEALMRYAQPPPPHFAWVDVWDLIKLAQQEVQARLSALDVHQMHLAHHVTPRHMFVWGDAMQLVQALAHVILNAIHAAPDSAPVHIQAERGKSRVGLHVLDRGYGIPQEYLHRVCDPFFTTKRQEEGMGLGLATALRIVEAHGGELILESREGQGTHVTFWLPMPP